jgi:hypothetical protein
MQECRNYFFKCLNNLGIKAPKGFPINNGHILENLDIKIKYKS